jgi:peptidoglycan hydrolase CwlO-like protein
MKKSIFKVACIAFASGIILSSCQTPTDKLGDSKDKVEDAQKDLNQAQKEYQEQYQQFKLESDAKISTNEQLIADLKTYSKDKKKEVKLEYEKAISDMEAKNYELKEKVETQKDSSNEKWQSFKREFNHDMDELGQSLKDLGKNNVK